MSIQFDRSGSATGFITPSGVESLTNKTIGGNSKYSFNDVTISSNSFAKPAATAARITSGSGPLNTITGGNDGNFLIIENKTGSSLVIAHDSGSNGFLTGTGAQITLDDDAALYLLFNASDSRWQVIGGTGAAAGTGGVNLLQDEANAQSGVGNWVASGSTVSISQETSTIPLGNIRTSAIKIFANGIGSSGDHQAIRFPMPTSLKNKKLGVKWFQNAVFVSSGNLYRVELWYNSQSDYLGSYTEVPLQFDDGSGHSYIADFDGEYNNFFDEGGNDYYELRIETNGGTNTGDILYINDLEIGPDLSVSGAIVGEWKSYTPSNTQGFGTITSNNLEYRRVGGSIEIRGNFTTGTVVASEAQIELPDSLTIDGTGKSIVGKYGLDSTAANNNGNVLGTAGDTYVNFGVYDAGTSNPTTPANGNAVVGNTTYFTFFAEIPIAEWAGSGTTNLGTNDVEYASNSDNSDADDTTSFVYGPNGSLVPQSALTNIRQKRVRFLTPIQPTDTIVVQVSLDGGTTWSDISNTCQSGSGLVDSFVIQNANYYGIGIWNAVNDTDIDVAFGTYAQANGATYGSAGRAWSSSFSSVRWRTVKHRSGIPVGFGESDSNNLGLVKMNSDATTANVGEYEEDQSNPSGTVTGGTISNTVLDIIKVGKLVTVQIKLDISDTPTGNVIQFTSAIPSAYRPSYTVGNGYQHSSSTIKEVEITSVGTIYLTQRDYAGASSAWQNQTDHIIQITYLIN